MEHQIKSIDGGKIQITITLTPEEKAKFELRAIRQVGSELNIKGFRPGHIPDDIVRKQLSPGVLEQEIMWEAVKENYPRLVKKLNLEVVGQPNLALQSFDPLVIHITVAQLPSVDLGNWGKIKIKRQEVVVKPSEVDKLIEQIKDSRASEVSVNRAAHRGDRVEIDFKISLGGVVIEGGQQTNYPVILGSGQLLPVFEDNLSGLKPGEEKRFEIIFPDDYRQDLAGKKAQAWAKMIQVFERTLPELNDEFARGLGRFEGADDLKNKLKQNLLDEKKFVEEQRIEREMLESLVQGAKFGNIPEILLISEVEKMLAELKSGISERGLEWNQYLQSIKKDELILKKEFSMPAERRVKVSLVVRAFAKTQNLEVDEAAVEQEIAHSLEHFRDDERVISQLNSEDYRHYVKQVLTNRRVIEWLKNNLVE